MLCLKMLVCIFFWHQTLKLTDWGVWYSDCGALVMLKNALTAPNGPEASIKQSQ